jgi:hypothetical protein
MASNGKLPVMRKRTQRRKPPAPTVLRKEKPVMVRATELEHADWLRVATEGGYRLATWARHVLNRSATGRQRQLLGELALELEWIRGNVKAVPGEGRAVDESWGNVERTIEDLRGRF